MPAQEAIADLLAGRALADAQWGRIVRFAMALQVRSPVGYLDSVRRHHESVPDILQKSLGRLEQRLAQGPVSPISQSSAKADELIPLPLQVTVSRSADGSGGWLRAEFVSGREVWLREIQYVLTETFEKVRALGQRWSIGRPFRDAEWFTSDNPLLRLNYYGANENPEYDFKGGWGNEGTEIILPLSPTHLLYAQIGAQSDAEISFNQNQTLLIQRFLAENAFRETYARAPQLRAQMFAPRVVNEAQFDAERAEWEAFHEKQSAAHSRRTDDGF